MNFRVPMENIYIQIIDDSGKSTFHNIALKSTVTLGKSDDCDIKITGKEIAMMHALIEAYDASNVTIRSLNQKNRVKVNGKSIEKANIDYSDIIKIGKYELQIKKVDLHDTYPDVKDAIIIEKEDLAKTLRDLTPVSEPEPPQAKAVFKTPISDDEIETCIQIPEESSAPKKSPMEAKEVLSTAKDFKTTRDIIRSSHSLRIKQFWWDVLISDRLFPLTDKVTIGSSKKNTFIIPPNGLSKKFPIFMFDNFEPYMIFNKTFHGYVDTKNDHIDIHQTKGNLQISDYKDNHKAKLELSDKGELVHHNIKFAFEFVPTPAPAARDKLFAKMDKTYRRLLLLAALFAFLILATFVVVPRKVIAIKPREDRFATIQPGALGPQIKPMPTPKPLIAKAGGSQGTEGEGAKAPEPEGKRGKSTQGKKGPTQLDLIRERGIGALMFFKNSAAMKDISAGGGSGGDLDKASGKLRGGLPGETQTREGKGVRGSGPGGGATLVGSGSGLGNKGSGLGAKGTGKADFGSKGEARVTAGTVEEGESVITGEMDPSIIERLIRANLGYIKWCYEKQLQTQPDIEGKIVVDFIIGVEGLVTSSKAKSTSMNNPIVEECIARRIKTIKFPSPGAGIVQVFYPFIFRVAGGF